METPTQAAPTLEKGKTITITDNGEEHEAVILDNTAQATAIVGFLKDGFYRVERRTFVNQEAANEGERALEKLKESAALIFDKIRNSLVVLETAAKAYSAQAPHDSKGEIAFSMGDDDHWAKTKKMVLEHPYTLAQFIINANMRLAEAMKTEFGATTEAGELITKLEETLTKEHELFEQAQSAFDAARAKADDDFDIIRTQYRVAQVDRTDVNSQTFLGAVKARDELNAALA